MVIIAESFVADERGREADSLERLGIEVVETRRPTYTTKARPELGGALDELVVSEPPTADLAPAPGSPLAPLKRPLRASGLSQKLKVNVAHRLLATYPDGSPAIVAYSRGKGSITYLAMPLGTEQLAAVLRLAAAGAHVEPLVRVVALDGPPTGIECRSVADAQVVLAYAWNTTDAPRRFALEAGPVASALDLTSGNPVPARSDRAGALLGPFRLGPGEVVILQLTAPQPKAP